MAVRSWRVSPEVNDLKNRLYNLELGTQLSRNNQVTYTFNTFPSRERLLVVELLFGSLSTLRVLKATVARSTVLNGILISLQCTIKGIITSDNTRTYTRVLRL